MNCKSYKNKIDERAFTAEVLRHLEKCSECKTFRQERECLNTLLGKLERVNAPANFEFGVKARLNSLPAVGDNNRVWRRRFVYVSPALAAVAVSALVLTNYDSRRRSGELPVASQQTAEAPVINALPSPTQLASIANADNANFQSAPIISKNSQQIASQNASIRQSRREALRKSAKNEISVKTIDEPTSSRILSVSPNEKPLLPKGFSLGDTPKIAAREALSLLGVEVSEDGAVKSVKSGSAAAAKGIAAGDRIETVNGQKTASANLENPVKEITVEVERDGQRRKISLKSQNRER